MAWTTPKDWATSELVTAANMNTHVRDNLNYLNDTKMNKELFVPTTHAGNGAMLVSYGTYLGGVDQVGSAHLVLPADYSLCSSVKAIIYPNASQANANWDVVITKFPLGDTSSNVTDATTTYNFVASQTYHMDLTTLWNSLAPAAGDVVAIGLSCSTDGHTGTYMGVRILYS
jgi:hypothetical protein